MKVSALVSLLLLSITMHAQESLVLVGELGKSRDNFMVVDVVEGKHIVLAKQEELGKLKSSSTHFEVLDKNVQGKEYYLVYPFVNTPDDRCGYSASIMAKYGKVLACFKEWVLMESTPERLHSMTEYKVQLDFLELEAMDFDVQGNTIVPPARKVQFNPVLKEMLDKVSPDSVEALERKLVSFHTRHARSRASKQEVIPWMAKIYKTYGCDTTVSLSLGSSKSPEIVGVRYGKKDRTIKKFVLLGGHTDNIISGASADTRHEGANDNATGQVAVLEACRVHQHFEFDYTILYATHNSEELGLNGSRAVVNWLKKNNAKTIGGNFSYDMFGMSRSDMKFRVYQQNNGASDFVNKMKELKSTYDLKQPTSITLTSSSSISSDPRNYWSNGFACIGHNFAGRGAGRIHTSADKITNSYDNQFQAEVAKLGIITTAYYAGVKPTSIVNRNILTKSNHFSFLQTARNVTFTLKNNGKREAGTLKIYNLKGKLIKSFSTEKGMDKVVWDGTNSSGMSIASNAVLLVTYTTPSVKSTIKLIRN